jgi:hypothetical protein
MVLTNSVHVNINGTADAGTVNDKHGHHSADSFAAVEINGARQAFTQTAGGQVPTVELFQKTLMSGGSTGFATGVGSKGSVADPAFVTVTDLGTGSVVGMEEVMVQNLDWEDALFSITDEGILLTIAKNDPSSFVSLRFATSSSWVVDPYTYGATLSASGLTAFGATPLSGWTLTSDDVSTQAFFAFGLLGQPFDFADVLPPSDLFTIGHTYRYDVGSGNGVFEVKAEIPEPSTLTMLGLGGLGMLGKAIVKSRSVTRQ